MHFVFRLSHFISSRATCGEYICDVFQFDIGMLAMGSV